MSKPTDKLTQDALNIWHAGLDAVRAENLMQAAIQIEENLLHVGEKTFDLKQIGRIAVVGAGKAGAGMAAALEEILGPQLLEEKKVCGWINVPAGCERELQRIMLNAARPSGVNEPTTAGLEGSEQIIKLVSSLSENDLCLCLISGGGSALLPYPAEGISLADKLAITKHLSGAGANIAELNTVRKQLSKIKGGQLATACSAGTICTLIISDVPDDPIDLIASGPTVEDHSTPQQALDILTQYDAASAGVSTTVFEYLKQKQHRPQPQNQSQVHHLIIGNNATAVDAAGMMAESLGYSHAMTSSNQLEGEAEQIGKHLADMAQRMLTQPGPNCLITGGEPVVKLVESSQRGKGGRNQQLVLAAHLELKSLHGIALLSGGTDGEDGPTDAAGAIINEQIATAAREKNLDASDFLLRNDAYNFFDPLDALIRTGPTNTNVCDIRVVCVDRDELSQRNT